MVVCQSSSSMSQSSGDKSDAKSSASEDLDKYTKVIENELSGELEWIESALFQLSRGFLTEIQAAEMYEKLLKRLDTLDENGMKVLESLDAVDIMNSENADKISSIEIERIRVRRKSLVDRCNQILRQGDYFKDDIQKILKK
uniref:BAG domain-containing protein n=1 Tax=Timspurckia oligopyrenoides TaxID=708627 RepID=A0A7S0ZEE9_9RHOD|mmetsp:Transcript_2097/g.3701  ORF Transcript_2097/g.3701 Transcript_2097/m.3701 type:complete len:142 (+) Transcript_2097:447-872(+)